MGYGKHGPLSVDKIAQVPFKKTFRSELTPCLAESSIIQTSTWLHLKYCNTTISRDVIPIATKTLVKCYLGNEKVSNWKLISAKDWAPQLSPCKNLNMLHLTRLRYRSSKF